jgi:hypothetical protein
MIAVWSVLCVWLGYREGRKGKWQEIKDFAPYEDVKPEPKAGVDREETRELTDG